MKIVCENFRCHENKTFTLPEDGLISLSGESGAGKSTLLSAIVYSLYGKIPGKAKKPYTHGKNTCRTELTYDMLGLYIKRSSKPNTLYLEYESKKYEGEAAQSVINQVMGMNYDEFLAAAYVIQRSNCSVISLSPTEQLKFIETLASTSSEKIKEKIKTRIKTFNETRLICEGEIKVYTEHLDKILPKTEDDEKFKNYKKSELELLKKKITFEKKKMETIQKESQNINAKLNKERIEYKNKREKLSEQEKILNKIEQYKKTISELDIPSQDIKELRDEIDQRNELIVYYTNYIDYKTESNKLKKLMEKYNSEMNDMIKSQTKEDLINDINDLETKIQQIIKNNIESDMVEKKREDAKKILSESFRFIKSKFDELTNIEKPTDMINSLTVLKEKLLKEYLDTKAKVDIYLKCPCCNKNLRYDVDLDNVTECKKIIKTTNKKILEKKLEEIKKNIDFIEINIGKLDSARKDWVLASIKKKDAHEYQCSLNVLKDRLKMYKNYESGLFPPHIEFLKSKVEKTVFEDEGEIEEVRDYIENNLNVEINEKMSLVKEIEIKRITLDKLEKEVETLEKIFQENESKIKDVKLIENNIKNMENKLSKNNQEIIDINVSLSQNINNLEKYKEYENYLKNKEEYILFKTKIDEKQNNLKDIQDILEGLYGLEETVKDAEIIALEETVRSINSHSNIYLENMFEEPIAIQINCIKQKKSVSKLQLNTVINYKGETYDDIEELSGGERQRCDMAFLLGVNDMLGSKIIMLDECLNNLDATINMDVLEMIKRLCTNKLILVISHEAVKGLFDEEILL